MKKILFLGIGGSGSNVVKYYSDVAGRKDNVYFLSLDTDMTAVEETTGIPAICLTEYTSLGNVLTKLDKNTVSEWFPCDDTQGKVAFFKTLEMGKGANGWRMKGLLSFEYMLSDSDKRSAFFNTLDHLTDTENKSVPEVYIVSSLCGGTGSALFLPIALFIKRYFSSKYNSSVDIKAILSCPDIYSNVLTAENRVKAYANAYAALSELNAVDLVSKGYNEKAKKENRCRISFKIGSKKTKGLGILFDSNASEFADVSAFPFKAVYIFDRIAGLNSVNAHETAFAKNIDVIVNGDAPQSADFKDVYAGVSLAEIVFPSQSIIEYVTKQANFDDIEKEWTFLYNKMDDGIADSDDAVKSFAKKFTSAYKAEYGRNEYSQYLALGREKEDDDLSAADETCPKIKIEETENYYKKLTERIDLLLGGKNDELNAEIKSTDKEIRPVKFFDGKKVKAEKAAAVKAKTVRYIEILTKFYSDVSDICKRDAEKFKAEIVGDKDEVSLFYNFIKRGGEFLHPVTTLLLLSELYIYLCERITAFPEIPKNFIDNKDKAYLPDNVFTNAKILPTYEREYGVYGETRLRRVSELNEERFSSKLVSAFPDMKRDLIALSEEISGYLMRFFLEQTASAVRDRIKKYSAILGNSSAMLAEHKVDVKLALIADTADTCTKMNVGADEENKRKAYENYRYETKNDFSRDNETGRIFYEYLDRDKDDFYRDLEDAERKRVNACERIRKACSADIFRVLQDKDIFKNNSELDKNSKEFKKAMSFAALPLDIAASDKPDLIRPKIVYATYIPESSAEFAREMVGEEGLSLQEATDKYLFRFGSLEPNVIVNGNIAGNKIITVKSVYDFELYKYNKINESNEGSEYYKNFIKALGVKKEQNTEMWNPHVVKENYGDYIPFIEPKLQASFENDVYKAVVYMLYSGVFFVREDEGKHEIFLYRDGENEREATFEKETISVKKPELLFGFIRENAGLAMRYGKAFDAELIKNISTLPLISFEKTDIPKFIKTMTNSGLIGFFGDDAMRNVRSANPIKSKNFVDFIYEMSEKDELKFDAVNLCKVIAETMFKAIKSRPYANEESYDAAFSDALALARENYDGKAAKAGRKGYKEKSEKVFKLIRGAVGTNSAE